jgi:hypothetical protein
MRLAGLMVLGCLVSACATPEAHLVDGATARVSGLASALEVAVVPGAVRLTLHVTNPGTSALELTFSTAQRYDFEVEGVGGERLWRWSADRAFAQVVTPAVLGPGETWTMEAVWEHGGRSGPHVATGWMTAQGVGVEQRASFELP